MCTRSADLACMRVVLLHNCMQSVLVHSCDYCPGPANSNSVAGLAIAMCAEHDSA